MSVREGYDWRQYCKGWGIDTPLAKVDLIDGQYYFGHCRNTHCARWFADEQIFKHWRTKFFDTFIEKIHHPEDESDHDVFIPMRLATSEEIAGLHKEIK